MSERLLNLFAPEYCMVCDSPGLSICDTCSLEVVIPQASVCYRCNKISKDNRTCPSCRSSTPIFSLDWIAHYDGVAKQLVKASKYKGSRSAIRQMAKMMEQVAPIREVDFVTHVPTATSSVRRRGLDHARLLSRGFCNLRALKHRNLLARNTQAKQMGANRLRRKNQMKTAFRARQTIKGKHILIIDDVISTGASLENCARVLKQAGAKRIYAAVFARN